MFTSPVMNGPWSFWATLSLPTKSPSRPNADQFKVITNGILILIITLNGIVSSFSGSRSLFKITWSEDTPTAVGGKSSTTIRPHGNAMSPVIFASSGVTSMVMSRTTFTFTMGGITTISVGKHSDIRVPCLKVTANPQSLRYQMTIKRFNIGI